MSTDATLTQEIFILILAYYSTYVAAVFNDLMASYKVFFRAFMILYTCYIGYRYAYGKEDSIWSIINPYLSVLIVYSFVLETSTYDEFVVTPFIELIDSLSIFFARGDSSEIFAALDKQALEFIEQTNQLWPSSWNPLDGIVGLVAVVVLYFVFFTMFFAFLTIYCISYFSMCLFFLVGGIFILFGTIKQTRGLFFAWLRNLFQHGVTIVFASISLGLSFQGVSASIKRLGMLDAANIFTFEYFSLIAWCLITLALILKSPDFAAGLTSTMAGSTAGIAGAMSAAGGAGAATLGGASGAGAAGLASGAIGVGSWLYNNRGDYKGGAADLGASATQMLKNKLNIKD